MGGIEKHIHQIWIGKDTMPVRWMDTIRKTAAKYSFKYTLWREDDIEKGLDWNIVPGIKKLYDRTERLSGKCNIARLLIIYQYGGIYIDADCVLLKPTEFMNFLEKNSGKTFFAWETLTKEHLKKFSKNIPENSDLRGKTRIIANSVLGGKKGSPFILMLLENLVPYSKEHKGKGSWRETGPAFVASMYESHKDDFDDVHIYPMRKFYPRDWFGITDPEFHKTIDESKMKSMFFQYGYSTNNFAKIFKTRRASR